MNLLGGLLQLPALLLGQGLKASKGETEQPKAPPMPVRDNLALSQEMLESGDLNALQSPLAPAYGVNQSRYDYNPQAARVEKLFESQMMHIPPV